MGFALPAAIELNLVMPIKSNCCNWGWWFQMTLQELGTILQSKVAVKIIILNNRFLGMVRQWQDLFFLRRPFFLRKL